MRRNEGTHEKPSEPSAGRGEKTISTPQNRLKLLHMTEKNQNLVSILV